ncbi:hypothetical protein [Hymenobacter negativus]|uniref:Zinc-finger domain-containing protein n=1 Tax=Hymenobacter negativus TaxID=2795026 RepID=A0ABS3Q990_9BACT|nr:hypothetical protein [Hymenobacter negativus]MBO2007578.1 hypothetical protein [Hymenobacter negativus]
MLPSATCHQPFRTAAHSTYFGYLVRLYLAAGTDELLPHQQPAVDQRLHELWRRLRLEEATAPGSVRLEGRLAHALSCPTCREAVGRSVSLFEALGPAALSWVA